MTLGARAQLSLLPAARLKDPEEVMPCAAEPAKKRTVVHGRSMAYVEAGSGVRSCSCTAIRPPRIWRNVMPHLAALGRCTAPDLIGMGDSEKLPDPGPDSYRFVENRRYLDGLLEGARGHRARHHRRARLGLGAGLRLVQPAPGQGQGHRAHGGDRAAARLGRVAGSDPQAVPRLRSEAGDEMVLQKNVFIERVLQGSVLRGLTDEEMAVYRRPYLEPGEARRPTLTWPRQIPLDGAPADVVGIVQSFADWLSQNVVPKLFVNAEAGAIPIGAQREFCRSWPNQSEVTVQGSHLIQEDSPDEIGRALAEWYRALR